MVGLFIEKNTKIAKHNLVIMGLPTYFVKYKVQIFSCLSQGMYKNKVKNDRKNFEIAALLFSQWGNPEWENSK